MTSPTSAGSDGTTAAPGSGAAVTTQVAIGPVEAEAAAAVQVGLGTAHAAVWGYGLISAYNPEDSSLIRACKRANEQIRDSTNDLLSSVGVEPIPPEPAYAVPVAVTDRPTAVKLATVIEKDCTNAWRAVIGSTDNVGLRRFALTALSDSAVRLAGWRAVLGQTPTTVPFPGAE